MALDEFADPGRREDIDGELCALSPVDSLHHAVEQYRELFPDFILLFLTPGQEHIGDTRQEAGIALMQPHIVSGAQSKKGLPFFSPEDKPASASSGSTKDVETLILCPTGILYLSAK